MPSERVARLALAALLQNLPTLAAEVDHLPAAAERVLRLAQLSAPADRLIVQLAATYALPVPGCAPLLPPQPLPSIFCVEAPPPQPLPRYYPLAPLGATSQVTDWLFPTTEPTPQARAAYLATLFTELGALADRLDLDRIDLAYPHLLAWLQRWARCLPGPGGAVSLLDHAGLSAAIAACLARYHADDDLAAIEAAAAAPRLRLLAARLVLAGNTMPVRSGPDADLALRRMAGRSFLLAAQADLIGHALADGCGLPLGNLIMVSGGTRYLLAPGHDAALAAIDHCAQAARTWLHANYAGEVALALAHVPLAGAQLGAGEAGSGFAAALDALHAALAQAQLDPGQGVLYTAGGWEPAAFVLSGEHYGEHGACPVCGMLPAGEAAAPCRLCAAELAAAQQLAKARYIAYYAQAAPPGSSAGPCGRALLLQVGAAPPERGRPYLVARLNDPGIGELAELPGGFRYQADMPPAPGSGLAEMANHASGRALLGYLGLRFGELAELLPRVAAPGQASAALAIGLSRELGLFSTYWLRALLSRPEQPALLVLGGAQGAPLLIGPWDRMAALALEIRAQLDRFGLHSPALTLMAGGLFTAARYPPPQAAAEVAGMLGQLRQPWGATPGTERAGDQLALLGDTIDWAGLPAILEEIDRLHARAHLLPAVLLHSLAEYGRLFRHSGPEQPAEGLRYRAQFAFNLARMLRYGDDELYRWGDRLIQALHRHTDAATTRHLSLIATWLLLLRPA